MQGLLGERSEAQYPLQIVNIDHTRLGVDVVDGNTGHVLGRQ